MQQNADVKKKTYKGYPLFLEVDNLRVRTWNRCATFFTIHKDLGGQDSKDYLQSLDDIARAQVKAMFEEIKSKGFDYVQRQVRESH